MDQRRVGPGGLIVNDRVLGLLNTRRPVLVAEVLKLEG